MYFNHKDWVHEGSRVRRLRKRKGEQIWKRGARVYRLPDAFGRLCLGEDFGRVIGNVKPVYSVQC